MSKNLTNAIGTAQSQFEPYLDNNNQALDYQRADTDQTHTFNFNGVYQLPLGKGRVFLNQGGIVDTSNGFGQTPFAGQVLFNVNPGQTGNVGRALINGPKNFNVNLALLKNIGFTESTRLQLRMEAFNALNNVNFFNNTQFANINSATFGQIDSADDSRTIQFAVRFEF